MTSRNRPPSWQKLIWLTGLLAIALPAGLMLGEKSPSTPAIKASNVSALRKLVGQRVTVTGKVTSVHKSSSGHQFLNFPGKEVSVICRKDKVSKFQPQSPADKYNQAYIAVTGLLQDYKGRLQVQLAAPEDIRRVTMSGASGGGKRVSLKQLSKETWISPAGLRYSGRDPRGLTRVEHIMRHAKDIPERDGPHGVFDGGREGTFGAIDEAWELAQKKRLKPRREGDRSTYTVRMQRRVGYLGGTAGKSRGNPPLSNIFIVFETGTRNIITAFPK